MYNSEGSKNVLNIPFQLLNISSSISDHRVSVFVRVIPRHSFNPAVLFIHWCNGRSNTLSGGGGKGFDIFEADAKTVKSKSVFCP